jgi:hypothetical protein
MHGSSPTPCLLIHVRSRSVTLMYAATHAQNTKPSAIILFANAIAAAVPSPVTAATGEEPFEVAFAALG